MTDPDGDELSVVVTDSADTGPIERTLYTVVGSDTQTVTMTLDYSYRGKTITIEGTVSDGELEDSDSVTIEAEYPGGCSTPTTAAPTTTYSPATAPPTTSGTPNAMPTLTLYDKFLPSCLSSTGFTTIRFRVTDPEGQTVTVQPKVGGMVSVGGATPATGPSGQIFTVNLRAADAGKVLTVTGSDFVNITPAYSTTITSTICA